MAKKTEKTYTSNIYSFTTTNFMRKKVGYYYKELLTEIWKFKLLKKAII